MSDQLDPENISLLREFIAADEARFEAESDFSNLAGRVNAMLHEEGLHSRVVVIDGRAIAANQSGRPWPARLSYVVDLGDGRPGVEEPEDEGGGTPEPDPILPPPITLAADVERVFRSLVEGIIARLPLGELATDLGMIAPGSDSLLSFRMSRRNAADAVVELIAEGRPAESAGQLLDAIDGRAALADMRTWADTRQLRSWLDDGSLNRANAEESAA